MKKRNLETVPISLERREALFSYRPAPDLGILEKDGERIPIEITEENRHFFGPAKNKLDYPRLVSVGSAIVASALELEMQSPPDKRGVSLVDRRGNFYSDLACERLVIDHKTDSGTLKHTAFFKDMSERTDGLIIAVDDIAVVAAAYRPASEASATQAGAASSQAEKIAA